MPSLLATSGTEAPAASSASAWRSLRMICSGVCLLFIESPSPPAHLGPLDSHSNWISFREAGQFQALKPTLILTKQALRTNFAETRKSEVRRMEGLHLARARVAAMFQNLSFLKQHMFP